MMRRCIAAGRMRPDAMIEDIPLLMCGVGSASAMEHPRPDAWRRHLGIVLDGLRAEAASSTPCNVAAGKRVSDRLTCRRPTADALAWRRYPSGYDAPT